MQWSKSIGFSTGFSTWISTCRISRSDAMDADARSAGATGAEVSAASKARALYVALRQVVANDAWSVERCSWVLGGAGWSWVEIKTRGKP